MSRILICAMLMAALSSGLLSSNGLSGERPEGPAARTSPLTRIGQVGSGAGPVAGAVSHDAEPEDTGPEDTGPEDTGPEPALRFSWPLSGSPTVVRAFHPPAFRYGPGHRGVDLATAAGAPVLAADAGTVAFAGTVAGVGVVSVDHAGGLRTTYEPVSPTVALGDRVARGERIGTVRPGHPGCPVAVCLHWGVLRGLHQDTPRHDRQYFDPLRLLAAARVRLLPTDDMLVMPGSSASAGDARLFSRRWLPASCSGAVAPP